MFNENNSLLIYDGDCGFCNSSLSFAYSTLKIMPRVEPFQNGNYLDYNLTSQDVENAIFLCHFETKNTLRGHLAIAEILKWQQEVHYRILGGFLSSKLFYPIFSLGYYLVARYRRYLPGGTPNCGIKPAKNEA